MSINRSIEISSLRENRFQDAQKNIVAVFLGGVFFYWLIVDARRGFYLRPGEEPLEDRSDAIDQVNRVDDAVRNTICFSLSCFHQRLF